MDLSMSSLQNHFETKINRAWRRHEMETFSASLALCEGNPSVTDYVRLCFSHVRLKELFSKHSNGRWSGTPWRSCDISGIEFVLYIKICYTNLSHFSDVIMSAVASWITGVSIVCSTVCSGTVHEFSWFWNNYRTLFTSALLRTIRHFSSKWLGNERTLNLWTIPFHIRKFVTGLHNVLPW